MSTKLQTHRQPSPRNHNPQPTHHIPNMHHDRIKPIHKLSLPPSLLPPPFLLEILLPRHHKRPHVQLLRKLYPLVHLPKPTQRTPYTPKRPIPPIERRIPTSDTNAGEQLEIRFELVGRRRDLLESFEVEDEDGWGVGEEVAFHRWTADDLFCAFFG